MNEIVDEYIKQFPSDIQVTLNKLRNYILNSDPQIQEKFSYQMPSYTLHKNFFHFAVAKKHIGIYPGSDGIDHFKVEFDQLGLKYSKGALQTPLNQPFPFDLITQIIDFKISKVKL